MNKIGSVLKIVKAGDEFIQVHFSILSTLEYV